jgi:RNA polymerase primary sigma factor
MRQLKITQSITNRDSRTLEKYFNEISKDDLLTPEEEVDLAQRIREGDQAALDKLVKANLRFVVSVAKQYHYSNIPLNDLINEGNLGLVKAAKKFDEKRGFKFISYAVWWIRQSIIQALSEHSRIVRLPSNKIGSLSKIDKAASLLEQRFEREPTDEELAEMLEMSIDEINKTVRSATKQMSIDKPFSDDEGSSLLSVLEDEEANTVDSDLFQKDSLKKEIERLLSTLDEREKVVVTKYFGLDHQPNLSLEDIGDLLGLTRERVRQIKEKALQKLANHPKKAILKPYLAN